MAYKLTHLSAAELARLIRTKKASPVEVTEAHLAAIGKVNPVGNAFCTVAAEKALASAREAQRPRRKGADRATVERGRVAGGRCPAAGGVRTNHRDAPSR